MQVTSFLVEGTTILWGSVREFENWRKLTLMGYNENCEILSHFRVLRYFSILFLWSAGSLALTHCNLSELSSNLKLWKRKFSETNHVRAGKKKPFWVSSEMVVDDINSWNCLQTVLLLFVVFLFQKNYLSKGTI